MTPKIEAVIKAVLEKGGVPREYTFKESGLIQSVPAYEVASIPGPQALQFSREQLSAVLGECATLVRRVKLKPDPVPSFNPGMPPRSRPLPDELWLILSDSLACQISILESFGYSDHSDFSEQRLRACKELLTTIYRYSKFKLYLVMPGFVAIQYCQRPNRASATSFIKQLTSFLETYRQSDFSEAQLLREAITTGYSTI